MAFHGDLLEILPVEPGELRKGRQRGDLIGRLVHAVLLARSSGF
jgi:hypothetical protein